MQNLISEQILYKNEIEKEKDFDEQLNFEFED